MKNQCHKGLLIPWLREALDKKLYEGLGWENEDSGIFYIVWTHKSAEHWSIDVLKPFKAWAEYKGKLTNKNPKTLKATFRCALNSKKDELRELKRQKNVRFWQFIDKIDQGTPINKKGPKPKSKRMTVESNNRVGCTLFNSSLDSSSEDIFRSSEKKTLKKRKRRAECKPMNNTSLNTSLEFEDVSDVENRLKNCISTVQNKIQKQCRTAKLPSFQSVYNSLPPTPPYQDSEIFFSSTESRIGINSPDASRLTPPLDVPLKNYSIASPYHQQLGTDHWQPNCLSIFSTQQNFNSSNQFSSDLDKSIFQKSRSNKIDFPEMDQFVPVMNADIKVLCPDESIISPSRTVAENSQMCDQMRLEDLLSNNDEAFEKIFQELNNMSSSPDFGGFNFNN